MFNSYYTPPINNLLRVNGIEGARSYNMSPNSICALFDSNEDIFYIKSSDSGGFSTIKAYKFEAINSEVPTNNNYVTKEEFNELKEALSNGKFTISKSSIEQSNANAPAI